MKKKFKIEKHKGYRYHHLVNIEDKGEAYELDKILEAKDRYRILGEGKVSYILFKKEEEIINLDKFEFLITERNL